MILFILVFNLLFTSNFFIKIQASTLSDISKPLIVLQGQDYNQYLDYPGYSIVESNVNFNKCGIYLVKYENDFNKKVLTKLFKESGVEFHEILKCHIYAYLWKNHPLANKKEVTLEELEEYPCLSFDQGKNNSFYFAEEVLSTYSYKRLIKANDRATFLNLMVGLNGYTLCSGIICEELNGEEYCAVKLKSDEIMTIGYIVRKGVTVSHLGRKYLEEISKFKDKALE